MTRYNKMMHNATMSLTLSRADHDLRNLDRCISLPKWVIRTISSISIVFATRALRKMAEGISTNVLDLHELSKIIEDSDRDELIDLDGSQAEYFVNMMEDIKVIHQKTLNLKQLTRRKSNQKLCDAADQLVAIVAEYHEAVARCSWAILEHDASLAERTTGYQGASPEEIDLMLNRITAGT